MELSNAQQILVIFLSSALAIFLILGIVIAVLAIRILKSLRRISQSAEHVVQTAESVAMTLKDATSPVGIFKFIRYVTELVSDRTGKGKK